MAKLTEDEARTLRALQDKAKAPDTAESNKILNISIDLADEAQVKRAQGLGLLGAIVSGGGEGGEGGEGGGEGEGGSGGEGGGEETPKRRGFFPES